MACPVRISARDRTVNIYHVVLAIVGAGVLFGTLNTGYAGRAVRLCAFVLTIGAAAFIFFVS